MIVDHITVRETVAFDATAGVRRTRDGYLVAEPRVARTGIQVYGGTEVGRPELDRVRVYRPEGEVFDKAAMASIAFRPVTNDHPSEPVTADNWRKLAVGQVSGEVARDGEFIRVPLVVMDGPTIADVESGKRQLSLGYTADLVWRTGVTDSGEAYDAMQTNIRVNHLAIVDTARGGSKLAIGDASLRVNVAGLANAKRLIGAGKINRTASWSFGAGDGNALLGNAGDDWEKYGSFHLAVDSSADASTKEHWKYPFGKGGQVYRRGVIAAKQRAAQQGDEAIAAAADSLLQLIDKPTGDRAMDPKTFVIDGISVEMSDTAHQVVQRALQSLKDEAADAGTKLATSVAEAAKAKETADAAAAEAKKAIETKDAEIATLKKQLEDSKLTPTKLDEMVKDRAEVIGKAKAVIGDALVVDGKDLGDIRKQVVTAKLGDACKDWTDEQVRASFATLTADVKIDATAAPATGAARATATALSGKPAATNDAVTKAYDNYKQRLSGAWKNATVEAPAK